MSEIYRLDANGNHVFNSSQFNVTLTANEVFVTDKYPPKPKAFYRLEAIFSP